MFNYAHVVNGVVVGIYCFSSPVDAPNYVDIDANAAIGLGWLYDGSQFIEPEQEPQQEEVE